LPQKLTPLESLLPDIGQFTLVGLGRQVEIIIEFPASPRLRLAALAFGTRKFKTASSLF
jgi:hypothetical protein